MKASRLRALAEMASRLAAERPVTNPGSRTPESAPWELGVYDLWQACYGPSQQSPMSQPLKDALLPDTIGPFHQDLFNVMWNAVTHHNQEWDVASVRLERVASRLRDAASDLDESAEAPPLPPSGVQIAPRLEASGTLTSSHVVDAGRYTPQEILGTGHHGEVWRFLDTRLDRHVAIKFFLAHQDKRLAIEQGKTLVAMSTEHMVAVYDSAPVPHPKTGVVHPALVLEHLDGKTLSVFLRDSIGLPVAKSMANQMVATLRAFRTAGFIHGDLHSENVMVVGSRLKLLDPWYTQVEFEQKYSSLSRGQRFYNEFVDCRDIVHDLLRQADFEADERTPQLRAIRASATIDDLARAIDQFGVIAGSLNTSKLPPQIGTTPESQAGHGLVLGVAHAPQEAVDLGSEFFESAAISATNAVADKPFWELRVAVGAVAEYSHATIRDALYASQVHSFGWPIVPVLTRTEVAPIPENGAVASPPNFGEYWRVALTGEIYAKMPLFEASQERLHDKLKIDVQLSRIAEALLRASLFYEVLGFPHGTKVRFRLHYHGLMNRELTWHSDMFDRVSKTDTFSREVSFTLPVRNPALADHTYQVARRLFGLFRFFEIEEAHVQSHISKFLSELGKHGLPACLSRANHSLAPVND